MKEYQNKLYLYDSERIYEFDLMMNWSNTFEKSAFSFSFFKNNIIGLNNQTLTFTSINSNESYIFTDKNLQQFKDFQLSGTDFYFSEEKKISKFKLFSTKF